MAGLFDLESHLVFYRSYHFNQTNVTIHLFCIPIILFTAFSLTIPYQIGNILPHINVGTLFALAYATFYLLLDPRVGFFTFPVVVGGTYLLSTVYQNAGTAALTAISKSEFTRYATIAHVLAWLAQFYGHGVHERRSPALKDNLLQALVLAPFFVAFEVAFGLGFKKDLKKNMDNRAGKLVRDFKLKQKQASS